MLINLLLLAAINAQYIIQVAHIPNLQFKAYPAEIKSIFPISIQGSYDTALVYKGSAAIQPCRAVQMQMQFHTHTMTLIKDEEFNEQKFDPAKPINIRSFIAMAQISDGIIAMTSDLIIFMVKFNANFAENDTAQNYVYNDPNSFATLVWKADIQQVLSVQDDMPQLLYSADFNELLIILPNFAVYLSVKNMEANNQEVLAHLQINWMNREFRGWTAIIKNYLFSAVGADGIDVYEILDGSLKNIGFLYTLSNKDLFENKSPSHIEDVSGFSYKGQQYLYLVDNFQGIWIFQVVENGKLVPTLQMIGEIQGGIALDMLGSTLVCIYENYGRYKAIEYYIDMEQLIWFQVRVYYSSSKLADVQLNNQFALLKGVEFSEFFITGIKQENIRNYSPIKFLERGIRGETLFNRSLANLPYLQKSVNISGNQFLESDIILGVTGQKMFFARYRKQSSYIECFWPNNSLVNEVFEYDAIFNTTVCYSNPTYNIQTVCQQKQSFKLVMVEALLREVPKGLIIGLVIGGVVFIAMVIMCVLYLRRSHGQESAKQTWRIENFEQKMNGKSFDQSKLKVDMSGSILKIQE